jgi:hypothetical protein
VIFATPFRTLQIARIGVHRKNRAADMQKNRHFMLND